MKSRLKVLLRVMAFVAVLPVLGTYYLVAAVSGKQNVFPGYSQFFALLPGKTGVYLRQAFYRAVLPDCGPDACLSFGTILSHPDAVIGRGVYVGNFCSVGDVTIADDVLIASHVSIMNGTRQHGIERFDVPVREQDGDYPPIFIGQDSWIGERATVAATVGRHCVIGAGALVLKPVPDYAIVVGVPARIVGDRRHHAKDPQPPTSYEAPIPQPVNPV